MDPHDAEKIYHLTAEIRRLKAPRRHCMTVEQQLELAQFVNRNSLENGCDMPDFAIAAYLAQCYQALCIATESHVDWEKVMEPGAEDADLLAPAMCPRGHGSLENGDCPDCGYAT